MRKRRSRLGTTFLVALLVALTSTFAYGQGAVTTTLSGTVVDSSGGVIPGADVTAKHNATGAVFTAVSDGRGSFTIPAMPPGTYTVTVALMGFKTWSTPDLTLNAAIPAAIKATLEVGKLEETVVVEGAAQLVQTQVTSVATTLSAKQISNLPISRSAFDVVLFTPGIATSDGSLRDSTVSGLPTGVANITLDGMNIQDNYAKSWDGMFTRVNPRLDAVEEVTVGIAGQGADMSGQGAVQIKFVTRSGTNNWQGSAYYYFRREWMNTNTWFNLHRNVDPLTSATPGRPTPKPVVAQYQPGARLGGPIIKDKAFFFINYEDVRSPGTSTANRTILSPLSEQGVFQYGNGKSVNLFDLAAKNGQTASVDPTVAKLIADIRSSTSQGTLNTSTDPTVQTFAWQQPTRSTTKYPTIRLDYNATTKHRVSASLTQNHLVSNPDTTNSQQMVFPGFPVHGLQDSYRWTAQLSLRSTLSSNMVNEVRLGGTGGATLFSPDLNTTMYSSSVGNMNGYSIGMSTFNGLSNPSPASTNSAREGATRVIEDTLSWIKGSHSISTGFGYTLGKVWLDNAQLVPTINFGIATGDPADAMFNSTNLPGAGSTDLTNARNLYALLTGRVTNIGYTAYIGPDGQTYVVNGRSHAEGNLPNLDVFFQDSWKWKPYLTINAGLRYAYQRPFYAINNSYSTATITDLLGVTGVGTGFVPGSTVTGLGNVFHPGINGSPTTYQLLAANTPAYKTDKNNLAPSIGVAWKVGGPSGLRHLIFGDDAVIRGGYNIAYLRGGMSDFTEVFGYNPGLTVTSMTRNQTNGNLGTLPVLLRSSDLGPGPFNATRTYPMTVPSASSNIQVFDPNIKVPWASSMSLGVQRAINKSTAVEARFIHTGSHGTWTLRNTIGAMNYNEVNILENGFLNEFKVAQQNLIANVNAGLSNKGFAYTGAAGTAPLPIMLAWFNGKSGGAVNDPTAYSGSGWTNGTYQSYLYSLLPNPQSFAASLRGNATYVKNAANAGLPANFFVANPEVNNAYLTTNGPDTRYNGMQLVLTRRFAQGLQIQANYTYGRGYQYNYYGFHSPQIETEQNYSNSGNSNASGSVRHVFAANWVYELPFGQGKRFGGSVGRNLNRLIGNWAWMGTARLQSGRLLDFGNVRLVGMTPADLEKMFTPRMVQDPSNPYRTLVYMLPDDVIANTIKAFSVSATGYSAGTPAGRYIAPANGPDCIELNTWNAVNNASSLTYGAGQCGTRSLILQGPKTVVFDMSVSKDIRVTSRVGFRFDIAVYNVFNNLNLNPVGMPSASNAVKLTSWEVTGASNQSRTGQLAFRIVF